MKFSFRLTDIHLPRRSADSLVLPEAAPRKARQDGEQGLKGCGQARDGLSAGLSSLTRRLKALQLEVKPGSLGMVDFIKT